MILYHNTSNTNAINIFKEGIIPGKRLSVYGKGSEAEGSGIWCTSKRGYGYGGATITFKIDDNDKYLTKQNDTEYIVYRKIDTSDIIDIDLVISSLVSSNSHNTVESDIPMLIKKFGKNKVLDIFKKYDSKFIEPYNYKNFENLINTGKKLLIGNININEQYNYKFFNILNEARLNQLEQKTRQQTPKLANRADFVNTDYIGISKFGIFNFRTTSQSNPGKYWYQTLEVPDLQSKLMDENITPDLMKRLIEQDDIKLYCDDPSFLYWSFKYMAWVRDYGIEPEERRPKLNNVNLEGALCKHLLSIVDLLKSGQLYEQMAKDADNWFKYTQGDTYKSFNKGRLMGDAKTKKNRINYETYDSYMNDYFASKAGINKFLDDEDIKGSLKAEIERTAKTDPSMTLDDFITDEFGVDGIQGLANELQIDIDYVKDYFKNLGF